VAARAQDARVLTWDAAADLGGEAGPAAAVSHLALCAGGGALVAAQSARLLLLRPRGVDEDEACHVSSSASTVLRGHTGRISCLEAARDGALFATASADRTVRVWSAAAGGAAARSSGAGGRAVHTHTHATGVTALAPLRASASSASASWSSLLLASGAADGVIRVGDAARAVTLRGHGERIAALAWADGCGDATSCADTDDASAAEAAAAQPLLLSGAHDGRVKLWDVAAGACVHTARPGAGPLSFLLPGCGSRQQLVFAGGARKLVALDTRACGGVVVGTIDAGTDLHTLTWQGAQCLVTGHADGTARIWDTRRLLAAQQQQSHAARGVDGVDAGAVACLRGHAGAVTSIVADGHKIVTGVRTLGLSSGARRRALCTRGALPLATARVWCAARGTPRGALPLCGVGALPHACTGAAADEEGAAARAPTAAGCLCGVTALAARGGLIAVGTARGCVVTRDYEESLLPAGGHADVVDGARSSDDLDDSDDGSEGDADGGAQLGEGGRRGGRFWLRAPAADAPVPA
jgi:hypothetical protein